MHQDHAPGVCLACACPCEMHKTHNHPVKAAVCEHCGHEHEADGHCHCGCQ